MEGACASTIPKSIEIDLGQEYLIDGMLIISRLDAYRFRIQDMKVDFKDADGTVVLTTAAITSEENMHDGYVMDLTKEGDQLNGAGEFDAWKYIPEGDVVKVADFDWRPYRRWCAVDEYWDGAACKYCPGVTTSPGGVTTVCCAADEYADGSACVTCPAGSTSLKYVMCICDVNEYWDGTSCAACTEGSFSAGGNRPPHRARPAPLRNTGTAMDAEHVQPGQQGQETGFECMRRQRVLGQHRAQRVQAVQCGRQCDHHIVHDLRRYGILEQVDAEHVQLVNRDGRRDFMCMRRQRVLDGSACQYAHWARSVREASADVCCYMNEKERISLHSKIRVIFTHVCL